MVLKIFLWRKSTDFVFRAKVEKTSVYFRKILFQNYIRPDLFSLKVNCYIRLDFTEKARLFPVQEQYQIPSSGRSTSTCSYCCRNVHHLSKSCTGIVDWKHGGATDPLFSFCIILQLTIQFCHRLFGFRFLERFRGTLCNAAPVFYLFLRCDIFNSIKLAPATGFGRHARDNQIFSLKVHWETV